MVSAAREAKGADGGAAGTRWNSLAGSRQYAHGRYGGCSLLPAGRNSQHRQRGGGAGDGQPQYRVGRQAGQQRHKGEAKRGALLGVLRHSALPGHGKKAH